MQFLNKLLIAALFLLFFVSGITQSSTYMRTYNFLGMNGGLGLYPTSDGGFVGTGQHENGPAGACDIYVYKVTGCGSLEWYKTFGSAGSEGGKRVVQTSDGGYVISTLWDDGAASGGSYEFGVLKLDAAGAVQWNTVWNNAAGNAGDYGLWIEEVSGGYVVSGSTAGSPWAGWNAIISFYNTAGTPTWAQVFGGGGAESFGSVHAVAGGYIAGGYTTSFGAGGADLLAVKVDATGSPLWMYSYGSVGNEGRFWDTEGIPTPDGGYLIAGGTDNPAWSLGGTDNLVVKLDASGAVQWAKTYGGLSDEVPEGVQVTSDGYIITGYTYTNTNGGRDAFVMKLDTLGVFQWVNAYGTGGADRGVDIIPMNGGADGFVLSMNRETALGSGDYDPMFVRMDSLGAVGCNVVGSVYSELDVTSLITRTTIPASASQPFLSSLTVSNPVVVPGALAPNEIFLCSSCNSINPSWSISDTLICNGDTVTFINQTTGGACFDWNINGNSIFVNGDTLRVAFDTANGVVQNVTMQIFCGSTVNTLTQAIHVSPYPNANFSFVNQCYNDPVIFTDSSLYNASFPIVSWNWSFGDATFDFVQNTQHIYPSFGVYNATLLIADTAGCRDSITKQIETYDYPNVDFTFQNKCEYDSINFTDLTTLNSSVNNYLQTWNWNFNDATLSTLQSPSHLYSFGQYAAKLVVTTNQGCSDSVIYTVIAHPLPVAGFSVTEDCFNVPAIFIDTSSITSPYNIAQWEWVFGSGGAGSILQNPSYTYPTNAIYNVTFIVTSDSGCIDTIISPILRYAVPVPYFITQDTCVYNSAIFVDQSQINSPDNITSWIWNFGDGSSLVSTQNASHLFMSCGTYNVTLITSSDKGCVGDTTLNVTIYDKPVADFTASTVCENTPPTVFTDLSNVSCNSLINIWEWDFGSGTSNLQNPTFPFIIEGNYPVILIVKSNFGCSDTITKDILIYETPFTDFSADTLIYCHPYCSQFEDISVSSTSTIISLEWTFSNGITSSMTNPLVCFNNETNFSPMYYDVGLIAENTFGCFDTILKTNYITVLPRPFADFSFSPQSTDIYESEITFINQSIEGTFFEWDFGDSNTVVGFEPTHTYADSGDYNVILYVENQYNCKDTAFSSLVINPAVAAWIPNAFTPDGDGINDSFFFKGYGVTKDSFRFMIFNKWGEVIYYTERFLPWDGTFNNLPVQEDVYVYKMIFKDIFGALHEKTGNVTLLR